MAYTRGSSNDIIVGAAALFTYEDGSLTDADLPAYVAGDSYKDTLQDDADFRNVGYTMNGLEIQFQPDFGEVAVDQVLDVAKLFKQGMQVNLNTTFAESTLENLLFALAGKNTDLATVSNNPTLNLSAGDIGDVPVERGLVAVGPGTGDAARSHSSEPLSEWGHWKSVWILRLREAVISRRTQLREKGTNQMEMTRRKSGLDAPRHYWPPPLPQH